MFKSSQLHEKLHFSTYFFCYQDVQVVKILDGFKNFWVQQEKIGIPKCNQLLLSLLVRFINLSCQSLGRKKTDLIFIVPFAIVIG